MTFRLCVLALAAMIAPLRSWAAPELVVQSGHAAGLFVTSLAVSPSGTWAASGDNNGNIVVYSVASGKQLARFTPVARTDELAVPGIASLRFSVDDRQLSAITVVGELVMIDLASSARKTLRLGFYGCVSADGKVAAGSNGGVNESYLDESFHFYDLTTLRETRAVKHADYGDACALTQVDGVNGFNFHLAGQHSDLPAL